MEKFVGLHALRSSKFSIQPPTIFHTLKYPFLSILQFSHARFTSLPQFRIKQVTRLQDAKVLLSIISYRYVLILNSVALLCVHTGGVISKHDPYRWFVRDSAKLH